MDTPRPHGLWFLLAAIVAAGAFVIWPDVSLDRALAITLPGTAIAFALLILTRRERGSQTAFDPAVVFAFIFVVWHFGFWYVYAAGSESLARRYEYLNFAPSTTGPALILCFVAFLALLAGLRAGLQGTRLRPIEFTASPGWPLYAILAFGAALIVLYYLVRGHRVVGDYSAIFTEEDAIRRMYNLGTVLVLGGIGPLAIWEPSPWKRIATLGLAVLPAIALTVYMGSRWVAFSAVLVLLMARALRGARTSLIAVGLAASVLIPASSLVKDLRAGNLGALSRASEVLATRNENVLLGFPQELGQTFLAVNGVLVQHTHGEPFHHGNSFAGAALTVAPSLPALTGIAVERPSRDLAFHFFAQRAATEGYAIGYSVVAELYLNFGVAGVVVGVALMGLLIGRLIAWAVSSRSYVASALLLVTIANLCFGIRNDAATWLRYLVWAALMFGFLASHLDARRRRAATS